MARVRPKRLQKRAPPRTQKPARGRPRTHQEQWSKINVVLFDRQVSFLDQLSVSIRRATGAAVNRTQILRALIDALRNSRINISTVESEAELVRYLTGRLMRRAPQ